MRIKRSKFKRAPLALGAIAVFAGLLFQIVQGSQEPRDSRTDQTQAKANRRPEVAGTHRILVLDIHNERGDDSHDLRLIEVESGKVIAQVDHVGFHTDVAIAPRGDVVAILTSTQANRALEFLRAGDLTRLEIGELPSSIHRIQYQQGASRNARFTPDGKQFLVQSITSAPGKSHLATTLLTSIERKLDDNRTYRLGPSLGEAPRSYGFQVVRVADWPRVHFWNAMLGLLEVADQKTGKITNKLYLGDDPEAQPLSPAGLEKSDDGLALRLRFRGLLVAQGRYGYYIPRQPWNKNEPGFLKKVDLGVYPPRVIRTGEIPARDLHPGPSVVSEAAGAVFVVQEEFPLGGSRQPSRKLKVYATDDLKLLHEVALPLSDCQALEASSDGRYVYVLNSNEAKIAVLDATTTKMVKVLENVGSYPHIILAVPEMEK